MTCDNSTLSRTKRPLMYISGVPRLNTVTSFSSLTVTLGTLSSSSASVPAFSSMVPSTRVTIASPLSCTLGRLPLTITSSSSWGSIPKTMVPMSVEIISLYTVEYPIEEIRVNFPLPLFVSLNIPSSLLTVPSTYVESSVCSIILA